CGRIRVGNLGGATQSRELAVACRTVSRNLGKGSVSFCMLAFGRKDRGCLKGGASLGSLLGDPIFTAAPAADREEDHGNDRDDEVLMPLPQLFELLSAYLFIDFLKDVRHVLTLGCRPESFASAAQFVASSRSGRII